MPKKSKDKGSRYERKIAKIFSKAFNRDLRRVPLSGGLDIKCDIYDPFFDDFPYFIECKHREIFTIDSIINGTSELYEFTRRNTILSKESYLISKYKQEPIPIVVFKGGNFKQDMVIFNDCYFTKTCDYQNFKMSFNNFVIIPLNEFIKKCSKTPLTK